MTQAYVKKRPSAAMPWGAVKRRRAPAAVGTGGGEGCHADTRVSDVKRDLEYVIRSLQRRPDERGIP